MESWLSTGAGLTCYQLVNCTERILKAFSISFTWKESVESSQGYYLLAKGKELSHIIMSQRGASTWAFIIKRRFGKTILYYILWGKCDAKEVSFRQPEYNDPILGCLKHSGNTHLRIPNRRRLIGGCMRPHTMLSAPSLYGYAQGVAEIKVWLESCHAVVISLPKNPLKQLCPGSKSE